MSRADQPFDAVERPKHYNVHPSGIECIEFAELMRFSTGNAIKYVWRAGLKGERAGDLEDYRKASWYLKRAIEHDQRTEDSFGIGEYRENIAQRRLELVGKIAPHHPQHINNMLRLIVSSENATSRFRRATFLDRALAELQQHIALCAQEKY